MLHGIQLTQRWSGNCCRSTDAPLGFNSFSHALLTNCATSPVAVRMPFNFCLLKYRELTWKHLKKRIMGILNLSWFWHCDNWVGWKILSHHCAAFFSCSLLKALMGQNIGYHIVTMTLQIQAESSTGPMDIISSNSMHTFALWTFAEEWRASQNVAIKCILLPINTAALLPAIQKLDFSEWCRNGRVSVSIELLAAGHNQGWKEHKKSSSVEIPLPWWNFT